MLKITKPQKKAEEKFKEACRKYVDGEASIDYLLDYIKRERLITQSK